MKIPAVLAADPRIAAAIVVRDRAVELAQKAEVEFNGLSARGVPTCAAPFDESEATKRLALARAHDAAHGQATAEAAEHARIKADRTKCAQACADSEAAVAAAQAALDQARTAHEAAQAVYHGANNALLVLFQELGEKVLERMADQARDQAAQLYELAVEIREVALLQTGGGVNIPKASVEVVLAWKPSLYQPHLEAGAHWGSRNTDRALVFEQP